MKNILLSADGDVIVYSTPEEVIDNLDKYLNDFWKWMENGQKETEKYRIGGCLCYDQSSFIDYLNIIFEKKSIEVENLGWIDSKEELPNKYIDLVWFNF